MDDGFEFEASPYHENYRDHSKSQNVAMPIRLPTPDITPTISFPAVSPSSVSLPMQLASLSHSPLTADFSGAQSEPSATKSNSKSISRSKNAANSGSNSAASTPQPKPSAPPKLLKAPPPRYPAKAKAAGIHGKTAVLVRVNGNGSAESTSLYHSSGNADLDEAAVSAARGWKFSPSPSLGGGETISVVVHVTFSL